MSDSRKRLAIDVGNSRIKLGLFDVSSLRKCQALPTCLERAVVLTGESFSWDILRAWLSSSSKPLRAVIAGSNPTGVERLLSEWPKTLMPTPLHVTNNADFPLEIDVDEPRCVGIDRLLNGIAVNALRTVNRPVVVVDSGTATTVDVVTATGTFAGGAILPGLALSARVLHEYTALLPLVSVAELGEQVPPSLGRNTREAIRSGLFWGQLGAVKELIQRQAGEDANVFVTGGGGALLASFLEHARYEPHLPLQGLVLVADQLELK